MRSAGGGGGGGRRGEVRGSRERGEGYERGVKWDEMERSRGREGEMHGWRVGKSWNRIVNTGIGTCFRTREHWNEGRGFTEQKAGPLGG